jgi:hypothetical protein
MKYQPTRNRHARMVKLKRAGFRVFVASRRGGNARGRGAHRSVVLGSMDGRTWVQHEKFWGPRHAEEAAAYVEWYRSL